ncbi:MAG: hypothetical protein KC416_13300 [Myxococcales bacterium]|nr:hypothetical protein [Myxococcales bacterium]
MPACGPWGVLLALGGILVLVPLGGCDRFLSRTRVDSVPDRPYPTCAGGDGNGPADEEVTLHRAHMRSGPTMRDQDVVEYYEFVRRDCLTVVKTRQEWPLGTADVEVVYGQDGAPLRVWKRMTLPSMPDPGKSAEISRFDLRASPVELRVRTLEGERQSWHLKGKTPTAVVGPGRGILSAWIRRAALGVGDKTREVTLDFRGPTPEIEEVTLRRDPDRQVDDLGRTVRVYTVFGRESVFTDEEGWVLGDLAGLRPHDSLSTTPPKPIPTFGTPNPRVGP